MNDKAVFFFFSIVLSLTSDVARLVPLLMTSSHGVSVNDSSSMANGTKTMNHSNDKSKARTNEFVHDSQPNPASYHMRDHLDEINFASISYRCILIHVSYSASGTARASDRRSMIRQLRMRYQRW